MNIDKLADYIPQESPFGYCMNNPILYIDPLGLSSEKLPYNPKTEDVWGRNKFDENGMYIMPMDRPGGTLPTYYNPEDKGDVDYLSTPQFTKEEKPDYIWAGKGSGEYINWELRKLNTTKTWFSYSFVVNRHTNPLYGGNNGQGGKEGNVISEIPTNISNGGSIVTTEVSLAADMTIKEMAKKAPQALKVISKMSNGGGGILGTVDNGIQTYNDYQKGNYYRATVNGTQGVAYLTGTILLFTPFAPIGGAILLGTTISDWIQSGVEYGIGINNY